MIPNILNLKTVFYCSNCEEKTEYSLGCYSFDDDSIVFCIDCSQDYLEQIELIMEEE